VRNALHAAAGRAVDRFVTDLREPAAHWLGSDVLTTAARLTAALDVGERLADRRWPDLHAEQDRLVGLGRRVFSSLRSRFSPAEPSSRDDDSVPAIAVRAAGRVDGARLTGDEERLVACAAPTPWSVADRNHLLTLLSAGTRGRAIFDRLRELGWVERELPEWTVVATAPQIAPFHDHPVGPHLWRTVDEVLAIASSRDELAEIAAELGSTEELVLAAFLHDIGKAHGGEHEVVGAGLAADILQRLGFGPATMGVVVDVVRNHLLLSETATRRDIADLTVIGDVAARIGDRRRLDVLYLVTVADLRATGTSTWNEWRATLLRILYERTRQAMAIGVAPPATADIDAILAVAAPETSRRAVEEHVAAMPPDYLDTASPGQVMSHIRAAAELSGPVSISSDASDPGLVLVSGADRTGFLLAVTRAFAAHGIGVVDARLRTRDDGIALDTFRVRDDVGGGSVDGERWPAVEMAIEAALTGADDLRPAVRRRAHHYDTAGSRGGAPTLRITARRSGPHTAVEVRAQDRIGLLAEIVEALGAEGLDIHLAKIDTLGGEARDVFHVRRSGAPIVVEAERDALCRRIRDRLSR
jgi:[protein-PII] uridylyltransferase